MKRVFVVSLLFMLLLSVTVFAEDIELAPIEDGFDGFSWGISKEEIKRAYPSYGAITEGSGNLYHTNLNEDSISNIPLWNTIYMFDNGKLNTGIYIITDSEDGNEEQLLQYLIEVYGEPDESYPAGSEVVKHDYFTGEDKTYSCCYTWLTPDGANELSFKKEPNSSQIELSYHVDLNTLQHSSNADSPETEIQGTEVVDEKNNVINITDFSGFPFGEINRETIEQKVKENGYEVVEDRDGFLLVHTNVTQEMNGVEISTDTMLCETENEGLYYLYLFKDDKCCAFIIPNVFDYYIGKLLDSLDNGKEVDVNGYEYYEYSSGDNAILFQPKYGLKDKFILHDFSISDYTATILVGSSGETIIDAVNNYNKTIEKGIPSSWKKTHYVDEFGDPTDEVMYLYTTEGTFSNTVTDGSNVDVAVVYDPSDCSFRFHFKEYGRSEALFIGDPTIKVKCGDDVVAGSRMTTSSNYSYAFLKDQGYVDLLNALREKKPLKVAVVCGNSKYIFEL